MSLILESVNDNKADDFFFLLPVPSQTKSFVVVIAFRARTSHYLKSVPHTTALLFQRGDQADRTGSESSSGRRKTHDPREEVT